MSFRSILATLSLALLTLPAAAQANTATCTNYGPSCGPVLNGVVTPTGNTNRVSLTVSNAAPRSVVLLWIGDTEYDVVIPGFTCTTLTSAVFIQQHLTDTTGAYTWSRSLGDWTGTAFIQFAEVTFPGNTLQVRTTNGVRVDCN